MLKAKAVRRIVVIEALDVAGIRENGIIRNLVEIWQIKFQENQIAIDQNTLKRIALSFQGDPLDSESE